MANKKYKLANSDYWETSGVYDITEGKTQRQINAAKVPNTRTVNGKALSADITLSSEDIGDDSGAGGANVKASLAALKGSINDLNDITGDGALSGFTATDLTGAANELKGSLNTVEGDVTDLQTVQKIPVTVTVPSQFNLDSNDTPKVYRCGGLGILTIVAWTNQAIQAGTTAYIFSVSGAKIIPTQTKSITGEFDITISTGNGTDITIRALQGISNGYRVLITLPVYFD